MAETSASALNDALIGVGRSDELTVINQVLWVKPCKVLKTNMASLNSTR